MLVGDKILPNKSKEFYLYFYLSNKFLYILKKQTQNKIINLALRNNSYANLYSKKL